MEIRTVRFLNAAERILREEGALQWRENKVGIVLAAAFITAILTIVIFG